MVSNYPPGVTGSEYAISGPEIEREEARWCEPCQADQPGLYQYHRDLGAWWQCSECEWSEDLLREPVERDPDDAYDRAVDDRRPYA